MTLWFAQEAFTDEERRVLSRHFTTSTVRCSR